MQAGSRGGQHGAVVALRAGLLAPGHKALQQGAGCRKMCFKGQCGFPQHVLPRAQPTQREPHLLGCAGQVTGHGQAADSAQAGRQVGSLVPGAEAEPHLAQLDAALDLRPARKGKAQQGVNEVLCATSQRASALFCI